MRIFTLCILLTLGFAANAQIDKEPIPTPEISTIEVSSGNTVIGKVIDLESNKPIPAASVQLFAILKNDNDSHKDSLVAVMLTKSNGDFSFRELPSYDSLKIKITAVGHADAVRTFTFMNEQDTEALRKDVGNIVLAREAQQLEGIVITAARPAMKLGIDKKIFDVDQTITSKGGTAVDVMKNIPSLSVDVDGNVELRNSAPTIFVDGRPTILTLDQIPSDNIDRVELITNPSAKYDASSGGGIINIILKKEKRRGFNGLVSVTGGTPEVFRTNANLNLRQGKFNFFLSGNYSTSGGKSNSSSERINFADGLVSNYFNQHTINDRNRNFKSIRGGFDYFIDNRNTITLSQGYTQGDFKNIESQSQEFLDASKTTERYGDRTNFNTFQFRRNNSQLNYTHKFPKSGRELNASLNVNYGGVNNYSNIESNYTKPDGTVDGSATLVRNRGSNDNNQWTAKIDFTSPLNEHSKIETGLRSFINNYESVFNTYSVLDVGEVKLPLSNNYKYREQVHAAYFTYTGEVGTFGYQLGLRGEYSDFDGTLVDSAKHFGYTYPSGIKNIWDALFPSVFLSKKLNDRDELQLNYSRRVRRPGFWQLNPFIDINDPLNIQQGNPELKPEFRNSFELNYSVGYGQNNNFLAVLYYRNTVGDITRYSDTITAAQYEKLQNSAIDPDAILNTYINSKSNNRLGLELTLQQKIAKDFEITPSASFAYRKVNADVKDMDLSNEGFNWNAKMTANYKIKTAKESSFFNDLSFQLSGSYESPRVIPQGKVLEQYSADLALRKDLFKDKKGSIVFSVNDLFDTNRRGVIYDTPSFYQESYRRWRVRSFRVTFSYKFGNANFQLFKKNGGGQENGGDF